MQPLLPLRLTSAVRDFIFPVAFSDVFFEMKSFKINQYIHLYLYLILLPRNMDQQLLISHIIFPQLRHGRNRGIPQETVLFLRH